MASEKTDPDDSIKSGGAGCFIITPLSCPQSGRNEAEEQAEGCGVCSAAELMPFEVNDWTDGKVVTRRASGRNLGRLL
ncbi:hypothetical protein O3P69_010777 [Scylla paramamosain]|uniref:Uncharacterized protein n=1 Tax=Scylla paramamosain TaxID=85552 RepID=A0AAW0TGD0_SCYPA